MELSQLNEEYVAASQEDALLRHDEEREWIYYGENKVSDIRPTSRIESELPDLKIAHVHGIIANNEPLRNQISAGKKINTATHGEVLHVTLEDGRRAVAKFSESTRYGADMHFELRRGLEFERLGLTVIYGKTIHPVNKVFGFVMAPMGESLRHWRFPGAIPKPQWITAQTFYDLYTIFERLKQSIIPHPDVQFGITQNSRLLLFDYDYQRVDESAKALNEFQQELRSLMAHEFTLFAKFVGLQNNHNQEESIN